MEKLISKIIFVYTIPTVFILSAFFVLQQIKAHGIKESREYGFKIDFNPFSELVDKIFSIIVIFQSIMYVFVYQLLS